MNTQTFDFVIVGSGAGSVPAALVMQQHGKSVLIIEKLATIGGTSAFSGGVIWIPNNHHLNAAGGGDSPERAMTYFDAIIGRSEDVGPASSRARREAFIRNGAEMVEFLEERGMLFHHANWPDYFDNAPGGIATGRSLATSLFDVNRLGDWGKRLGTHSTTSMMPVESSQSVHLFKLGEHWKGRAIMAKTMAIMARDKVMGRTTRGAGNALQGRLFEIAKRRNVPLWWETPVKDLIVRDGRVAGVVVEREGQTMEVLANDGVLLNAGGFSRNQRMRDTYLPKPTSTDWTQASQGDTGEMIETAMGLGAAIDQMEEAVWEALSFQPDGQLLSFHAPNDIGKPHCITVNAEGKRFADECQNYMEYGQQQYAAGAIPAYAIFDSQHRRKYVWGTIPPGKAAARKFVKSGYLKTSDTLEGLARQIGMEPLSLLETVVRFNTFARNGVDEDFGRGQSAYAHYYGDEKVSPNPSLGTIEKPPYYAVKMDPGDLGTTGGLITDEHARVLREDGSVIEGLYATGNTSASVMGRKYLGAGATIGPSMTFGYIAAKHAAGANR